MNWVEIAYHLKRLAAMARIRGVSYVIDYVNSQLFFFSNLFKKAVLLNLYSFYTPYPRFIEVETTTFCNLRCKMCEHTYWDEKPRHMGFEQFRCILDQFPMLKWIGLTGIGSSFLNEDYMRMLRYVKSKNIYCEIYDSFFLLNRDIASELIDIKLDRLIMSIDAATKESYEKIRGGASFDRVLYNLKNLIELKKKRKAHYPEITFHYIISKENIHEVIPFMDMIRSLTHGELVSILFTGILHTFKEIKEMKVDVPDELIKEIISKSKELRIKVAVNRNILRKESVNQCIEWTMPFIFVDGSVVPCCIGNEANQREFQRETALGNIFQDSFSDIWYGERYTELRQSIKKGKIPPSCKNCTLYE